MPCGFVYRPTDATGSAVASDPCARSAWWADAAGIPPGAGVGLFGGADASADPTFAGLRCLRALWEGDDTDARMLHASVSALTTRLPHPDLPVWVVHGADDGLLPAAFTSEPYVAWLRAEGRTPRYWQVPHVQHFDAFLALPGFGDGYVPLLPYAYAALNQMWSRVVDGSPLSNPDTPPGRARGAGRLEAGALGFSAE
jgi:hydroxybutyrate-dimer hydrolase